MATQYDPIAKDASLNTTESPSRNLADVIAQSLASLIAAMPATVLNNLADVVITLPTDGQTLKYDSVSQKWVNADDAGGHTIVDASDADMPQRASMQFVDAGVSDDAVNDVTKVEVVQEISAESDLNSAPDGVYQGTWEEDPSDVLTADMVGVDDGTGDTVADRLAPNKTLITPKFGGSGFLDRNFYTTDYETYFELHFCIDVTGATQLQNKALFDLPDFAKGKIYQYGVGVASALGTAHGVVNAGDYIILSNQIGNAVDNFFIGTFRMSLA